VNYGTAFDPAAAGEREMQLFQIMVEHVFKKPFLSVASQASAETGASAHDLLRMGRQLFFDTVRVARGELSEVSIPARMPYPGEYDRAW
jgi:hypothetical protein